MDKSNYNRKYKPLVYKLRLQPVCIAAIIVFFLLMLEPSAVISSMQRSLRLCAGTVIPALFPYLVASELLVRSGAGERLAKCLAPPIRTLYGVSDIGAMVYVMGILCGFPVAARTAAAYQKEGKLSREEVEHLLCFCNVPGAAFLINAVGVSLYTDVAFGWLLWGLSLLSAAIVGVAYRLLCRPSPKPRVDAVAIEGGAVVERVSLSAVITSAAGGMISVVATVLFFGALLGAMGALLSRVGGMYREGGAPLLPLLSALLAGAFEMTGGVASAAQLWQREGLCFLSHLLCGAAVGWGGLSVHFQLLAASDGIRPPLRVGRFFLSRLAQCVLCALGVAIWLALR